MDCDRYPSTSVLPLPVRDTSRNTDYVECLRPCYEAALRYCHALCADTHCTEAEDLLQNSLLRGLEKFDQLADHSRFRPWLFKIITRTFQSSLRKKFWRRIVPIKEIQIHIPEIYRTLEIDTDHASLLNALARLTRKERATILLFEVAGFSVKEVRQIIGDRSVSATKSRLSRTRQKLAQAISRQVVHRDQSADSLEEMTLHILTASNQHES